MSYPTSPPPTRSLAPIGSLEKLLSDNSDWISPEQADLYAAQFIDYLDASMSFDRISILSFDVFDTLLLRNEKYELYRYLEISQRVQTCLQQRGFNSATVWDIYAARLVAFKTCYRTVPHQLMSREGRLLDILTLMLKLLAIEPSWVNEVLDEVLDIELTYEQQNLRPNPLLDRLLQHPRIVNKAIILVSDMYLAGTHIHQLVQHFYPHLQCQAVYSSADYSLTKSNGLLFEQVIRDLKVERSTILHWGDNFHADVKSAKSKGLQAIHLPIPDRALRQRAEHKQQFLATLEQQGFDLTLVY
ncbi:MAG: hypothetical protein MUF72_04245 [Elainella sp. Prado103]|jgi:predicted HAD superfamily hydrolase|nr:hypothetical protein [Elainella sp. Prado103]